MSPYQAPYRQKPGEVARQLVTWPGADDWQISVGEVTTLAAYPNVAATMPYMSKWSLEGMQDQGKRSVQMNFRRLE